MAEKESQNELENIEVPFEKLPEARQWRVGSVYRVKLTVKQVGMDEDGAEFQILDATSLEPVDRANQTFMTSDSGAYMAK